MPRATPERAAGRSALLHAVAGLALAYLISGGSAGPHGDAPLGRRRLRIVRRTPGELFLTGNDLHERDAAAPPAGVSVNWPFQPTQLHVDLSRGAAGVPVLLVPVPVPGPPAACDARALYGDSDRQFEVPPAYTTQPAAAFAPTPASTPVSAPVFTASIFTSQQLLEEFIKQKPLTPELPPMLLPSSDISDRAPLPYGYVALAVAAMAADSGLHLSNRTNQRTSEPRPGPDSPPPLYHEASLALMRARLTVPRADYTEPYTVWFDPASGNARVDFHGGATSTFRSTLPDGRVRHVVVWVERWSGDRARRCASATSRRRDAPAAHPALPDLASFSYAGTEETPNGPVELWQRTVTGAAGGQGAARGEVLTTRHEMRLTRVDGAARPRRYTVTVDSSVLGSNCDGYEHVYEYEAAPRLPAEFFDVDLDVVCDSVESLQTARPEHLVRLQPLREFTQPSRDLRYDRLFQRYQAKYARRYADELEEAVRKNVLVQSSRVVASSNRQGATARLGAGPMTDRLNVEVRRATGGTGRKRRPPGAPPPISAPKKLGQAFDWRTKGAVSDVEHQGLNCSSCWAFAVAGAVEGALFRRTNKLTKLSPKALLDCISPTDTGASSKSPKNCSEMWPADAFEYVKTHGLVKEEIYGMYKPQMDQCKSSDGSPETFISGHVDIPSKNVQEVKMAISEHGPVVVMVDASCSGFKFYKEGVLQDNRCHMEEAELTHAILAVGWNQHLMRTHFIVKNSWGKNYGENGYIRLDAESNTCGVATKASYPLLDG